ncbi:uncharacterized protein METZ01_LOCUS328562, partial [marine metagenome]
MYCLVKRTFCSLSLIGYLLAGEVDFNVKMNSVANTVATYWNENATGVYIYFTPTDGTTFTSLSVYITESTTAMAATGNSGDCDTYFTLNGSARASLSVGGAVSQTSTLNGASLGGVVYTPSSAFSASQYTLYIPKAVLAGEVSFTEGSKLYIALNFNSSASYWTCPESTDSGVTSSDITNDYGHFNIDITDPTIASLKEHTSNETYANSMYINTYKITYIVGAEDIAGGITWDSISGTDKTDSDGLNGSSATTTYTGAANKPADPTLADGEVYNITFDI